MINSFFSKHKAFTLAEVLITLGIIGVIAALTTPALVQSAARAKIGPELAKVYNTLSEANQLFLNDNNAEYLSVAMKKNGIENTTLENLFHECLVSWTGAGTRYKGYIQAARAKNPPAGSLKWNGEEGGYKADGQPYQLTHGSARFLIENPDCALTEENSRCGIIIYTSATYKSSTGTSGPKVNQYITGGNVFKMYVANDGSILLDGSIEGEPYWNEEGCTKDGMAAGTDTGFGCAGRIANRGWRVDY